VPESAPEKPPTRLHVVGEGPSDSVWFPACARLGVRKAERMMARLAITGAVGRRLAGLLDEPWPEGLVPWRAEGRSRYALRNLQDVPWSERPWSDDRLRPRAAELLSAARAEEAPLLLLGRTVARAFDLEDAPFCSWSRLAGGELVGLLPHPSRRSTCWNDRDNAEEAVAFLRAARRALDAGVAEDTEGCWRWGAHPLDVATSFFLYRTRAEALAEARRCYPSHPRAWTARVVDRHWPPAWLSRHES